MHDRAARVAVAVLVAAALATALVRYPTGFRELNNRAAHNAQLSEAQRDVEILERLAVDPALADEAKRRLPRDATFGVVTGPAGGTTPLAQSALAGYFQNLLLPRRLVREEPQWLLCQGCDPAALGGEVVWRAGPAAIARLRP